MSDEFLYRLRVTPPPALAAQLKLRLDAQAALQARRRTYRRLSVFAGLFLAGTALALVSPSLRNYALEVFRIETRQDKPEIAQAEAEKSSRAPVSPFGGNAGARAGGAAPAYQSTPDSQPTSTTAFNPFARTDRPAATESRPPAPVQDTPSEQTAPIAWRAGPPMTLEGSRTLVPLSDAVVARYQQRVSTPARIVSKHSDASLGIRQILSPRGRPCAYDTRDREGRARDLHQPGYGVSRAASGVRGADRRREPDKHLGHRSVTR